MKYSECIFCRCSSLIYKYLATYVFFSVLSTEAESISADIQRTVVGTYLCERLEAEPRNSS